MSVTRFLSFFLALALLVALCCIPAFAVADYSYSFSLDSELDEFADFNSIIPPLGDYNFILTWFDGSVTQTVSGVCNNIMVAGEGFECPMIALSLTFPDGRVLIQQYAFLYDLLGVNIIGFPDRLNENHDDIFTLELSKLNHPSFVDGISAGIDGVIGWIQEVTSSITTGPLLPLLGMMAVAICITGILFSVKFIRKTSWGH